MHGAQGFGKRRSIEGTCPTTPGGDAVRVCERLAEMADRLSGVARTIGAEGLALHLAFTSDEARGLMTALQASAKARPA